MSYGFPKSSASFLICYSFGFSHILSGFVQLPENVKYLQKILNYSHFNTLTISYPSVDFFQLISSFLTSSVIVSSFDLYFWIQTTLPPSQTPVSPEEIIIFPTLVKDTSIILGWKLQHCINLPPFHSTGQSSPTPADFIL